MSLSLRLTVCVSLLALNVVFAFGPGPGTASPFTSSKTNVHTITTLKHSVGRLTIKSPLSYVAATRKTCGSGGAHAVGSLWSSSTSDEDPSVVIDHGNHNNDNAAGIKKLALLTSGGDCPSLNACIRAIVKAAKKRGIEVYGLPNGFPGLLHLPQEGDGDATSHYKVIKLDDDDTYISPSMLTKGGCKLGGFVSSDFSIFDKLTLEERADRIGQALDTLGVQGIIATGGDSSLDRIAVLLDHMKNKKNGNENKFRFVGVPKTIDNDIPSTIFSLGFQSAVSTASQAIAAARDTAESHRRIIVVECMGRDAGFLTLHAGLAGGADVILLPEFPLVDEKDEQCLVNHVKCVYEKNQCAIVAVAESVTLPLTQTQVDRSIGTETGSETNKNRRRRAFRQTPDGSGRFGGSAETVARFLSQSLDVDARHLVLGHLQRGGSPNAFDQVLATTLGAHAIKMICSDDNDSSSDGFVTWNGKNVEVVPLKNVKGVPSKAVTSEYPELIAAEVMGIYCGRIR